MKERERDGVKEFLFRLDGSYNIVSVTGTLTKAATLKISS